MRVGGDGIGDEELFFCGVHSGGPAPFASACLNVEAGSKGTAFADDLSCFCMITEFDECVCACNVIGFSKHLATPTAFNHSSSPFVLSIARNPPQSSFG